MHKRRTVEWDPDLTEEDQAQVEQLVAEMPRRVTAMRALRKALGLTQRQFAELMGTTQSSVSKREAKDDLRLGELRRAVRAKGGRIKLAVEIGGQELELLI